jgi:hypothetical protein
VRNLLCFLTPLRTAPKLQKVTSRRSFQFSRHLEQIALRSPGWQTILLTPINFNYSFRTPESHFNFRSYRKAIKRFGGQKVLMKLRADRSLSSPESQATILKMSEEIISKLFSSHESRQGSPHGFHHPSIGLASLFSLFSLLRREMM